MQIGERISAMNPMLEALRIGCTIDRKGSCAAGALKHVRSVLPDALCKLEERFDVLRPIAADAAQKGNGARCACRLRSKQ